MGDKEELRKTANLLEKVDVEAIKHYQSRNTKISNEEVEQLFNATTYFTPSEAEEKGFAIDGTNDKDNNANNTTTTTTPSNWQLRAWELRMEELNITQPNPT